MTVGEQAPDRRSGVRKVPIIGSVSRRQAWGMTGLVSLLYVINYADKAILGIIAQPLARELGLTSSQIGLVGSLFFLTFTIGSFLAGTLNKYLALRWALCLLALAWSVVMLPLVVWAGFATLVVARMLLGLAEGPTAALSMTAVYSWHPLKKRGLPSAVLTGSANVAKLGVAPVLALITVNWGWRAAIIALSITGAVWIAIWLFTWSEGPYTSTPVEGMEAAEGQAQAEPSVPKSRIFLSRTFVTCSILIAAAYAVSTVVLTWLPSYFELGLGYSTLESGSMFVFPALVGLTAMLGASAITDKLLGRGFSTRTLRIVFPSACSLAAGAVLVLLPYISAPALAVAALSLGYGLAIVVVPLLNAAVSELCPPQQTASTLGVFIASMSIGGLIGPYATGLVVDHAASEAEGFARAFQAIGIVGAIAAVLVLIFANPARDRKLIRGEA